MSVRVVVADDQDLVRTGLAMILAAQDGIEVVGQAADGPSTVATVAVIGMRRRRPLSRLRSRVPVSWSTMPAAMNSEALKVAWFNMWNTAATSARRVFMPSSSVMRPRWLIVE